MKFADKIALIAMGILVLNGCGMETLALSDWDPTGTLETDSEVDASYEFDHDDADVAAEHNNLLTGAEGDTDETCNIASSTFAELRHDDPFATAGPALARGSIERGVKPPMDVLRTYEFLNYYDVGYSSAPKFALRIEADLSQIGDSARFRFQFGVVPESLETFARRPVNLVVSVDNSASMAGYSMEIARESCLSIADSLVPGDVVSITTWNPAGGTILSAHPVISEQDPEVIDACLRLEASGNSDLERGLITAYGEAALEAREEFSNRVILLSDGIASVSLADRALVAAAARGDAAPPIRLAAAGVGSPVNFSDLAMYTLADAGDGPYLFVDSKTEANYRFGERFAALVDVAADDITVSVQLPPTLRLVPAYGSDPPAVSSDNGGQEIAPGQPMIFHQQLESCELESVSLSDELSIYVSWRPAGSTGVESAEFSATLADLLAGQSRPLIKGTALVIYAEALKQIAQSISVGEATAIAEDALDELAEARAALGGDTDLAEASELLDAFLP